MFERLCRNKGKQDFRRSLMLGELRPRSTRDAYLKTALWLPRQDSIYQLPSSPMAICKALCSFWNQGIEGMAISATELW